LLKYIQQRIVVKVLENVVTIAAVVDTVIVVLVMIIVVLVVKKVLVNVTPPPPPPLPKLPKLPNLKPFPQMNVVVQNLEIRFVPLVIVVVSTVGVVDVISIVGRVVNLNMAYVIYRPPPLLLPQIRIRPTIPFLKMVVVVQKIIIRFAQKINAAVNTVGVVI